MPKTIQIRNLDDDVYKALVRHRGRAGLAGRALRKLAAGVDVADGARAVHYYIC